MRLRVKEPQQFEDESQTELHAVVKQCRDTGVTRIGDSRHTAISATMSQSCKTAGERTAIMDSSKRQPSNSLLSHMHASLNTGTDRHAPDVVVSHPSRSTPAPARRTLSRAAIPTLWCPMPMSVHPDAELIEERTITWMKRWGYIKSARQEEVARLGQYGIRAARVHPVGRTDAIQLASDLTVWLFQSDDVYVEAAGMSGDPFAAAVHATRSLRVLREPDDLPSAPDVSLLALRDISLRLRAMASCEQRDRVIGGMVEFFLAGCSEAASFSRKTLPSTADYVCVRDAINCLRSVCFVLIEIVGGFELPGPLWCRPELQAVVNLATRIVSNHHDLLSGLREMANELPMNLPAVVARESGLPVDQAFARVAELVNSDMQSFLGMSNQLLDTESAHAVRAYVDGLKAWIRGNLDWSLTTGRYSVSTHLASPGLFCAP